MKLLVLTRFGRLGASSRLRTYQFLPWLESEGISCVVAPLFADTMLQKKYLHGGYGLGAVLSVYWQRMHMMLERNRFDLLWIQKEALPWLPAWLELRLLRNVPYILDFDDAVFHNYDLHRSSLVRRLLGQRINHLMAGARMVVAGNTYLADYATAAGARQVEILPTVVDVERYAAKTAYAHTRKLQIVWIGSPSTSHYLRLVAEPLATLAEHFSFSVRIIGGTVSLPGVDVELCPWSADTEAAAIAACDIGIMPLCDTPWERGKCAYKLIQYMACGLPTVSSPIGANLDVVLDGQTGFFAQSAKEWDNTLEMLLQDAALRQRLGEAGRKRVEECYSLHNAAPRLVRLLRDIPIRMDK